MAKIGEVIRGDLIGYKGRHYYIWHTCIRCGKERWVAQNALLHGKFKLCTSCAHWKTGRTSTPEGYIQVKLKPDDFFYTMAKQDGYIMEHRLVMAKCLKRCLLPWEVVHHRNGIKDDNQLGNLELLGVRGKHNTIVNRHLKKQERRIQELEKTVASQDIRIKMLQFRLQDILNKIAK